MKFNDKDYQQVVGQFASLSEEGKLKAVNLINQEFKTGNTQMPERIQQYLTEVLPNPERPEVWGLQREQVVVITEAFQELTPAAISRISLGLSGLLQVPKEDIADLFQNCLPEFAVKARQATS